MAAFTPGNIVVYRVGTGAAALSANATQVFLDEFTPAGVLVQSIALPTAASGSNHMLTASGTSGSEGLLTLSADGHYLLLTGYDAAVSTASITTSTSTAINRVVGRVGADGSIDTSTALSDFATGSNPRGVVSTNGADLWVDGGAGGVRYTTFGATTSTPLSTTATNLRGVEIFDGQLYVSSGAGTIRIGTVGSGEPKIAGQTITELPGIPLTNGSGNTALSPYQFYFADLTAAVPGVDTLYVTDDRSSTTGGGLYKYSLVGGSWVQNGLITTPVRGLTGSTSGTSVTLFSTDTAATNHILSLVDTGGYNAAFSTTSLTTVATAGTNTAFRGIAFAPQTATPTLPSLTIDDVSKIEGDSGTVTYTFTVKLSAAAPAGGVTFDIATADGTATAASGDYVANSLTSQTILAGATTYTFDVTVNGDLTVEPNETFFVNITNVTGATIADGQGQGTIVNDDTLPAISIDSVSKVEGDSGTVTYTFTVSLDHPARTGGVTFDIATADGSATTADSDYVAKALSSQTIPAGQSSYTFDVVVNGDTKVEGNETFAVNLSNVSGATVANAQGTGTILNDDSPPALSIASVSKVEGDSGTTTFTFTVSLDHAAPAGGVTFDIATSDGTGTAGSDYVAKALTSQTIPAGANSYTFDVTVNGDTAVEPDETFNVSVSNVVGATVSQSSAVGTIMNDDLPPQVSIGTASVTEGNSGVSYLNFTVSLNHASTDAVSVDWATSNGTATAGSDYLATAQTVTFAPGETSKTVSVAVIGDTVAEANETVNVTLSNASGATIGQASGVGTIVNDDSVNYFSLASGTFSEDWTDTSRITTSNDWSKVASIRGYLGDIDSGTPTAVDPRTLTTPALGHVNVMADQTNPNTNTTGGVAEFQAAAINPVITNPTIALQGSGTADAPSIVLYMDASGRQDIHLTANLRDIDGSSDNAAQPIDVQYRTDPNGSWTNVPNGYFADVTTGPSLANQVTALDVVLPADANNAPTLEIRILTTNAIGSDEWVGIDDIVVSSNQGSALSYAISDAAAYEGSAGTTPISFTVTRVGDTSAAGTVDYATSFAGGGFSADASDFASPLAGTVSFAPGETSKTITLSIVGDTTPEADENFTVTLSNASSGTIGHAAGTGTIVNDDGPPPFVAISDVTQAEGDAGTSTFTFTVTRSGGTGAFTVDYATADGTANAGSDYVATGGTLSFAAGETSKTISVTVNGDTVGEPTEKFSVNLANPTGFAILSHASGIGTIVNDDPIPIYQIQGTGHTSPLVGQSVATSGIITGVVSNGFYIQDPQGDGNTATSDAIFVFTSTVPTVGVGDSVTVSGTVTEFLPSNDNANLTTTEINSPVVTVLSTGNPLPAAVLIGVDGILPPNHVFEDDGFTAFDPQQDGLDFYESLEGMLVTIEAPKAVGNTNSFGETWVVASGGQGATGMNERGGITLSAGDLNPERILIKSSSLYSGYTPAHSEGDVLSNVTGIMTYAHNDYQVLVSAPVTVTQDVTLPQEVTGLAGDRNHLTIASYNIENASIADPQSKFDILGANVVYNLKAPDIIALQEVQDADGPGAGTDLSGQVTAQRLIDAIKAAGGPTYVYVEVAPTATNTSGGQPNGNIRPGFLYNPDRVSYVSGSAHILTDTPFNGSRKPLVADFMFNGQKVELIDVHFTSRLGSDPLEGAKQPPSDAGDGSRTAQGQAVANYINSALAIDPSLKLGVVGDFNGFYFEGAVGAIEAQGLTDLHRTLDVAERYTYYFDGNSQAIDHLIVTPNLLAGAQFDAVHLNAEYDNNANRPTDHDPIVGRFSIQHPNEAPANVAIDHAAVDENRPAGTLVGTVSATDPDGDTVTYSLVDNAGGRFAIDPATGQVTTTGALDYEAGHSYDLTVRASDPAGLYTDKVLTIAVGNVNEAPTNVALDHAAVDENQPAGTAVGTVSASDPDGDTLTYHLSDDAGGRFTIDPTTGVITTTTTFDHEANASFSITATATDEGNLSAQQTFTITVGDVNEAPVPQDDAVAVDEDATSGNLWGTLLSNDSDPEGDSLTIISVDTTGTLGHVQFDAATQTLRYVADDDSFDALANGATAQDHFTYTVSDGHGHTKTATVTVTVTGIDDSHTITGGDGGGTLNGTSGEDNVSGGDGNDYIDLSQGGTDHAVGGNGNDAVYFGAAWSNDDSVDGGTGNDTVGFRGDYTGANAATIRTGAFTGVETLSLMTSNGEGPVSYDIIWQDGNLTDGKKMAVYAGNLSGEENVTFDGSAETHGYFVYYGGAGIDDVTGGANNDGFYFGPGKFDRDDHVDGGGGTRNQLGLDGNYTFDGDTSLGTLGGNFENIQTIVLYRGDPQDLSNPYPNTYHIVTNDAAVAAGQTLCIYGVPVLTDFVFDGSAEMNGAFNILSGTGNDTLTGGHGNDSLFGNLGADILTGGAGNDIFLYTDTLQSAGQSVDTITDFDSGDLIDLSQIDADTTQAGDQSFAFIGANQFDGQAGELRASFDQMNHFWIVEADVDGDGHADFTLHVATMNDHQLVATDFIA